MFALIAWLSLIPPLPLFFLSLLVEGPEAIMRLTENGAWLSLVALIYIAGAATVGGYALWGYLLRTYPAGSVAPIALLVPAFGILSAWLTFGEQFGIVRIIGIAVVGCGLFVSAFPTSKFKMALKRLMVQPSN